MSKQPYRITLNLKSKELFDFFEKLAEDHYNGNKSKAFRALLKEVKKLGESN